MKTPQGYKLEKFKLLKNGGLSATYTELTQDRSITNVDTHTIDSPTDPHPDLINAMDELRGHLADVYGMRTFNSFTLNYKKMTAKEQAATDSLKVALGKLNQELINKIEIRGIDFKGTEDGAGIIIKGVLNHNDYVSPLNTPIIKFIGEEWGFEEEVSKISDKILDEVEAYLFVGKAAQLDLFAESPSNNEEEEESEDGSIIEIKTAI